MCRFFRFTTSKCLIWSNAAGNAACNRLQTESGSWASKTPDQETRTTKVNVGYEDRRCCGLFLLFLRVPLILIGCPLFIHATYIFFEWLEKGKQAAAASPDQQTRQHKRKTAHHPRSWSAEGEKIIAKSWEGEKKKTTIKRKRRHEKWNQQSTKKCKKDKQADMEKRKKLQIKKKTKKKEMVRQRKKYFLFFHQKKGNQINTLF